MDTAVEAPTPQDQISECLADKRNFLLSGGAGSGKTHSLIETLGHIFNKDMNTKVACITYTNVATDEIRERAPYSNLWVSTIHEFLWNEIKMFQKNLKRVFEEELVEDEEVDVSNIEKISYKNYRDLSKGIISHNDLIKLAEKMFAKYPMLARMFCDKYDYILIDEYQDTDADVIKIFLLHIKPFAAGKLCVGMFGDKMQSIYNGVEAQEGISQYAADFENIKKSDNYRCSQNVIKLLNKIRHDLTQMPSNKAEDGSVANLSGSAKFVYSEQSFSYDAFCKNLLTEDWNFSDPANTKVLMLTHKLIAGHNNFGSIMEAYKNCDKTKEYVNDRLLGNHPDELARLLLRVCAMIRSFRARDYKSLLSEMDLELKNNSDKKMISDTFSGILAATEITVGATIEVLSSVGIIVAESVISKYSDTTEYGDMLAKIWETPLREADNYYEYYNGLLPFSTQHGVKGAEYENVLVVLDNGKWNKYNFKYLFEDTAGKENIIETTRKIFYVCCSRAKNNLLVFVQSPSAQMVAKAKEWFGDDNCVELN